MNERVHTKYKNYMKNVIYLAASAKRSGSWANIVSCPHLLMCLNVMLFLG